MRPFSFLTSVASLIAFVVLASIGANACPFCSAPSLTLSEQIAQADTVVLVKWIGGEAAKISDTGSTEFEVVEVVHQPNDGKLAKGGKINLIRYRSGKPGDQFMLFGTKIDAATEWGSPLEVTKTAFQYIKDTPKPGLPAGERLPYFIKYLEASDRMIADDAFGEFANAAYADVAKLADKLPRDQLRKWLSSKETAAGRLGLYGMMLGLCGNDDDAKLMGEKIFEQSDEFRLGIDGIMYGYLMLTGSKGLAILEDKKLKDKKAPFSETYAAMSALRYMWQYGSSRISPDRLRESMRLLLDRPELADLVIADLSRMKDWSVQDKLMAMYDEETNIPSVKRAIVRYMLTSAKDTGAPKRETPAAGNTGPASSSEPQPTGDLPEHVVKGQKCLKELEAKDPKTVNEAKRFFIIK